MNAIKPAWLWSCQSLAVISIVLLLNMHEYQHCIASCHA